MKAGKVWGVTRKIEANPFFELHRIEIKAGGYCSKHKHKYKWNGFYVESGRLEVKVWKNSYDLVDTTILGPGEYTVVTPGEYHMFNCLEDCVCFELYWAKFDPDDIERETIGGNS
jgi:quercetin dioxygenase-like cupin family protein